jgi:hypothetical protein
MITLNSCYTFYKHIYPSKEDCTSFIDTLHLLEQTMLYFARFGGQVYATISMLLGCKYISKCLFLNCDPLPYDSDAFP